MVRLYFGLVLLINVLDLQVEVFHFAVHRGLLSLLLNSRLLFPDLRIYLFFPFLSLVAGLRLTVVHEDLAVFYQHLLLSFIVLLKTHVCESEGVLLSCDLEGRDLNRLLVLHHFSLRNNLQRLLFRSCWILVVTKIEQIVSDLVGLLLDFLSRLRLHNGEYLFTVLVFDLYAWR